LVFVDETVFTMRSTIKKCWMPKFRLGMITKNKFSFRAIAVVAEIDIARNVIGMVIEPGSTTRQSLIQLLQQIRSRMKHKQTFVFLDNLALHKTHDFRKAAEKQRLQLVYNAPYSSEYNPIERLWGLSKKIFGRQVVEEANWQS
jgi:transposase